MRSEAHYFRVIANKSERQQLRESFTTWNVLTTRVFVYYQL